MKILVSDILSKQGIEILEKAGLTVDVKTKMAKEEMLCEIRHYEGLIVRSATKVTAEMIAAAGKLRVIGRAGSGLDNVDTAAATKRGIVVMNTPGGNSVTTAEHTLAMIFALARKIPQATASMKGGNWEKDRFMGVELYNKTLGIVGMGQIGGHLAKLAQGMLMNVIAYDPYLAEERARKMGVEMMGMHELFRRADIISVHTPLTAETQNIVNAATIATMKDGVRIINCARGGIINEKDLYDSLKSGKVAGAAFDVFEEEPIKPSHPLLTLDNFICTPHIGASTTEAQENVAVGIAEQIVDYLTRGIARGAVNVPSVPAEMLPRLQPYITLTEQLGLLHSQLYEGGIERVTIEYKGEVAGVNVAPLTIAALKGLLTPILEETINYVNAPVVARERGIEVKEVKSSDAGDFTSLITLQVEAEKKTSRIAGALYGRRDPRIVQLDSFRVEIVPEGHMLFILNHDRPGVIGQVGQILGEHQINIARMQCSREEKGGQALLIVGVDAPLPTEVLRAVTVAKNIISVKLVRL
ncbi:MAG TPA: phosphoglycerate dehydrogenase [Nitrospirales bacterium]|nr:phosphoglycerate dehydrogenase [Nitrospirales bacterium]